MGVVRGDRITESKKLNRVSMEAFLSYALFVEALADNRGQFRFSSAHWTISLLREDVTSELVSRIAGEYERVGLLCTWESDGDRWGRFVDYRRFARQPQRPKIPRFLREAVIRRDGGACRRCHSSVLIQLDHVVAYARGGEDTETNLQLLCRDCNLRKGVN